MHTSGGDGTRVVCVEQSAFEICVAKGSPLHVDHDLRRSHAQVEPLCHEGVVGQALSHIHPLRSVALRNVHKNDFKQNKPEPPKGFATQSRGCLRNRGIIFGIETRRSVGGGLSDQKSRTCCTHRSLMKRELHNAGPAWLRDSNPCPQGKVAKALPNKQQARDERTGEGSI